MLCDLRAAMTAALPLSVRRISQMGRAVAVALVIAATIAVVLPSAAQARENINLTIYGAGASPCSSWLDARRTLSITGTPSPLAWEQMGWVLGYLTAFSQHALPSYLASPVGVAVAAELDKYCADHPDELLAIATSEVATVIAEQQLQTAGRK